MRSQTYKVLALSFLSSFAAAAAKPQGSGTGLTSQVPPPPCLVSHSVLEKELALKSSPHTYAFVSYHFYSVLL